MKSIELTDSDNNKIYVMPDSISNFRDYKDRKVNTWIDFKNGKYILVQEKPVWIHNLINEQQS